MNQCPNCLVWIEEDPCPLCHQFTSQEQTNQKSNQYPIYENTKQTKRKTYFFRLMLLSSLLMINISLLVNLLTTPQFLWVFYVVISIFYLLIAVNHTIISSAHWGAKVVYQVISLSGLVIVIDVLSGFYRWSINFAVPFLIIGATLVITVFIIKHRVNWNEYVGFILTLILLGFLPMVIFLIGISTIFWPSVTAISYAVFTIIGILLFSFKIFKDELVRRFHV